MASLIYLASPYSHNSEAVRKARYLAARQFTIIELTKGVAIFSPIVYGVDMETAIGTSFEEWQVLNDTMIEACDRVYVLCLDGWQKSSGVKHEINLAASLGKPILYYTLRGELLNADHRHT